jgi:SAM-dependent methyltransferase
MTVDRGQSLVPQALVERLRCPVCGAPMVEEPGRGVLSCESSHEFSLSLGYLDAASSTLSAPRDSSTSKTFASFGYEWNEFDEIRPEDEDFARIYFRDVELESLSGKVGLDAGCGKGRFTRILAGHLDAVVALDGSSAVEAAARNLSAFPNTLVVKSDLRSAPLAPASFDFVTCLGVLHHLEDPHEGFFELVELLAPGGRLLVYLYSRPSTFGLRSVALRLADALRKVTTKMPHRLLRLLSVPIGTILYWAVVVPGRFGQDREVRALDTLPMSTYRDKPRRSLVLDTFDRLSAPVEHRYVWSDIDWWFSDAGLVVEAARDETGWFVLARKP